MPLYEYSCQKCDRDFELLVRGHEQPSCPDCGNEKIEKLMSVPASPNSGSLPMADPGTCGRPQCGMGGCQGMM